MRRLQKTWIPMEISNGVMWQVILGQLKGLDGVQGKTFQEQVAVAQSQEGWASEQGSIWPLWSMLSGTTPRLHVLPDLRVIQGSGYREAMSKGVKQLSVAVV